MNDYIKKVAGVILKNKKLLLVSSDNRPFFWTPGGKINTNESPEAALARELKEELNMEIVNLRSYITYISNKEEDGTIREVYNYLVEYSGVIKPQNEIDSTLWLNKEDYLEDSSNVQSGVKIHLIPKLIEDGLM